MPNLLCGIVAQKIILHMCASLLHLFQCLRSDNSPNCYLDYSLCLFRPLLQKVARKVPMFPGEPGCTSNCNPLIAAKNQYSSNDDVLRLGVGASWTKLDKGSLQQRKKLVGPVSSYNSRTGHLSRSSALSALELPFSFLSQRLGSP